MRRLEKQRKQQLAAHSEALSTQLASRSRAKACPAVQCLHPFDIQRDVLPACLLPQPPRSSPVGSTAGSLSACMRCYCAQTPGLQTASLQSLVSRFVA